MNLGRYGVREIMDVSIFKYQPKMQYDTKIATPILRMDYGTMTDHAISGNTVYATGGAGAPRRIAFHDSRNSELTLESEIFTMEHLAMLAGKDIVKGKQNLFKYQVLPVVDDGTGKPKISLAKQPISLQHVSIYKHINGIKADAVSLKTGATLGTDLPLDELTVSIGEEVEVYYMWKTTNDQPSLTFTARDFPKNMAIIGDTVYADEVAGDIVSAQFHYYKVSLQPNFQLQFSPTGDPSKLQLKFDVLAVNIGQGDEMFSFTLYDE